jgi:hypothetical protein
VPWRAHVDAEDKGGGETDVVVVVVGVGEVGGGVGEVSGGVGEVGGGVGEVGVGEAGVGEAAVRLGVRRPSLGGNMAPAAQLALRVST